MLRIGGGIHIPLGARNSPNSMADNPFGFKKNSLVEMQQCNFILCSLLFVVVIIIIIIIIVVILTIKVVSLLENKSGAQLVISSRV